MCGWSPSTAFTGHYQRVKMFLAEARRRIAAELADSGARTR